MEQFKILSRMAAAFIGAIAAAWLWLAACGAACAAEVTNLVVPLPAGETALTDIGLYQVWWQSYGGEPVRMTVSWVGHADERTGISYKPWGRVFGREALLIHSPWRVLPGRTWAEYQLALPHVTPIKLSFGIVMGPTRGCPKRVMGPLSPAM